MKLSLRRNFDPKKLRNVTSGSLASFLVLVAFLKFLMSTSDISYTFLIFFLPLIVKGGSEKNCEILILAYVLIQIQIEKFEKIAIQMSTFYRVMNRRGLE